MSIGPKSTSGQYYFYKNNDVHSISTIQEEKDLGVIFDENLYFSHNAHQPNNTQNQ